VVSDLDPWRTSTDGSTADQSGANWNQQTAMGIGAGSIGQGDVSSAGAAAVTDGGAASGSSAADPQSAGQGAVSPASWVASAGAAAVLVGGAYIGGRVYSAITGGSGSAGSGPGSEGSSGEGRGGQQSPRGGGVTAGMSRQSGSSAFEGGRIGSAGGSGAAGGRGGSGAAGSSGGAGAVRSGQGGTIGGSEDQRITWLVEDRDLYAMDPTVSQLIGGAEPVNKD